MWRSVFLCIASLLPLAVMAGCHAGTAFEAPEFMVTPAPLHVTAEQLSREYESDATAADLKYKGVVIQLTSATVDKVQAWFFHTPGFGYEIPLEIKGPEDYLMFIGKVQFKPRDPTYLQDILPGSIVDITGTCAGLRDGVILVDDCWIKLVGGKFGFAGGY